MALAEAKVTFLPSNIRVTGTWWRNVDVTLLRIGLGFEKVGVFRLYNWSGDCNAM